MVNASFIGYEIDMLFDYNEGEGAAVNIWFQGKVVYIVNKDKNLVEIKWMKEGLSDSDLK